MRTDELDYDLPEDRIAQTPAEPRDAARLLVDRGPGADPADHVVRDLPTLIRPGDLVVLNDTRVLPARVAIRRDGGRAGEVLLLEPAADGWWQALCRPSRKLREGSTYDAVEGDLGVLMGGELDGGRRLVRPLHDGDLVEALGRSGTAPLPPYITERLDDQERYQTVFAQRPASAAAPTAGLHLTPELLDGIRGLGASVARVELVVGLDTFRPITAERVEDHDIHSEHYAVSAQTWDAVERTRAAGGRVIAVGTTSVRALESVAVTRELTGRTRLFITPGYDFGVVDVMMTNFHLPRSSLLAMIEAFVGERWRDLYATALERRYRFLSFGDAMLLQRRPASPQPTGGDPARPTEAP